MECLVWAGVAATEARPQKGISVHRPAPKSAPDSTVYAVIPIRTKMIGTSASIVAPRLRKRQLRKRRLRKRQLRKRHPAEPPQDPDHRDRQEQVDQPQGGVAERDH